MLIFHTEYMDTLDEDHKNIKSQHSKQLGVVYTKRNSLYKYIRTYHQIIRRITLDSVEQVLTRTFITVKKLSAIMADNLLILILFKQLVAVEYVKFTR